MADGTNSVAPSGLSAGVYWTLTDQQDTVRDLLDSAGNVAWHGDYDAFGNLQSAPPAGARFLFLYTGKLFDFATGLQSNSARWYDPTTGRWLSEDPIGFNGGLTSLSDYVGNDPVNQTDPSGLASPGIMTLDFVPGRDHVEVTRGLLHRWNPWDAEPHIQPLGNPFEPDNFRPNGAVRTNDGAQGEMVYPSEYKEQDGAFFFKQGDNWYVTRGKTTVWTRDPLTTVRSEQLVWDLTKKKPVTGYAAWKLNGGGLIDPDSTFGIIVCHYIERHCPAAVDLDKDLYKSDPAKALFTAAGKALVDQVTFHVALGVTRGLRRFASNPKDVLRVTPHGPESGLPSTGKVAPSKVPNPYGKLGGPAHRAKVDEVVADIRARGLRPETEVPINTSNGQKSVRYMDVVAVDPKTNRIVEVHQVGRTLKSDPMVPVSRERAALRDVRFAPEFRDAKRVYHDYEK